MVRSLSSFAVLSLALACSAPKSSQEEPCPDKGTAPSATAPATPAMTPPDIQGDTKTVTLLVKVKLKPEFEEQYLAGIEEFIAKVKADEPDTVLYTFLRSPSEPHTYYWLERYVDAEARNRHQQSPALAEAFARTKDWVEGFEGMELEQIAPR